MASNTSERLNKFPDVPSTWVEQQGLQNWSLQEIMGQDNFDRICGDLSDADAETTGKKLAVKWLDTVLHDQRWN